MRTNLPVSAKLSRTLCAVANVSLCGLISNIRLSLIQGGWAACIGHSGSVCSQHSLHNGNFTTTTVAPKFMRLLRLFVSNENTREKRICIHLTFCGNSECKISTKEENFGSLDGFTQ